MCNGRTWSSKIENGGKCQLSAVFAQAHILYRVGRGKGSKSLHGRSGRSLIQSNALLSFLISRVILKVLNIKIKTNFDERQCQIR